MLTTGKFEFTSAKKLKSTFLWNREYRAAKPGSGSGARASTGTGNPGTAIHLIVNRDFPGENICMTFGTNIRSAAKASQHFKID